MTTIYLVLEWDENNYSYHVVRIFSTRILSFDYFYRRVSDGLSKDDLEIQEWFVDSEHSYETLEMQ
jgi:hypothetical protein